VEKINLSNETIPIFVIVKDRLEYLQKSVTSWKKYIDTPIEIIYIDQESTYPPMINYLKNLKEKVVWNTQNVNPINGKTDNNHFWLNWPKIIKKHIDQMTIRPSHFCVSDPDITFNDIPGDVLEVYATLLKINSKIRCVGAQLDINDIPHTRIMRKFINRLWEKATDHEPIKIIKIGNQDIKYQITSIDTTFAIFNSNFDYESPKTKISIRVRKPYSAKHLDWYIDHTDMTDEQIYYLENCVSHGGISHFGTECLLEHAKHDMNKKYHDLWLNICDRRFEAKSLRPNKKS
jgi:hypothetical protein